MIKYILFDIEIMSKDVKIYMIHNKTTSIYDIKDLDNFIKITNRILDRHYLNEIYIGDYFIGFDLPMLTMIKQFYTSKLHILTQQQMVQALIDFAYEKTQKLIRYGCNSTNAEFELLKQSFVFCPKYIDVKFVIATKTKYTGLKHYQGAILNTIQDFNFDQAVYDVQKLDEYGINDVITSMSRFKHKTVQRIYKKLKSISDVLGLYIVNFIPNQIIKYIAHKHDIKIIYKKKVYNKCYDAQTFSELQNKLSYEQKIFIDNLKTYLSNYTKENFNGAYTHYNFNINKFDIQFLNSRITDKNLKNTFKINLSLFFHTYLLSISNNTLMSTLLTFMKNELIQEFYLYHALLNELYKINSNTQHTETDAILIQYIIRLLDIIQQLETHNIVIYGFFNNNMYVIQNKLTIKQIQDIFKQILDINTITIETTKAYIHNFYGVLTNKYQHNTGIFDIEHRIFEKYVSNPSIASTKKFINQMLQKEIYTVQHSDYIFVVGPCTLGLMHLPCRANMLVFGNEKLIIQHSKQTIITNFRYQQYTKDCMRHQEFKYYYELEFSTFFK